MSNQDLSALDRPRTIPGLRGYRLLGVLPQLWRNPLMCLTRAAREYGDVVSLPLGPVRTYLITHPDHIKQVLQDRHQLYSKGPHYKTLKPIFGNGLITSEGELWRRQRHLAQPAFHRKRRGFFAPIMTSETAALLKRWVPLGMRGETINLTEEMTDLAKTILFKAMFGGDVIGEDGRLTRPISVIEASINPVSAVAPFTLLRRLPTPGNRRLRKALCTLNEIVYRLIRERRRNAKEDGDLLSMLLLARDENTGEGMSDEQLRDEAVTILQAGLEPPADALTWTFCLLSQAPAVRQKLEAEVAAVLGGRVPSVEDLPNLVYTTMVIHEVLRLYPPAWTIARSPLEDDEIGGYLVPAKSLIVISPYVTHRLPAFWEAPEIFDPERFLPERWASRPRFAYFPFGGGPRLCAGEPFALTELPLAVAMVVQAYRLELVPGQRVEPRPWISLMPPENLAMRLVER